MEAGTQFLEAELMAGAGFTTRNILKCMNVCDFICVCVFLWKMKDFKGEIYHGQGQGEAGKVPDSGRKCKGMAKNRFLQDQD